MNVTVGECVEGAARIEQETWKRRARRRSSSATRALKTSNPVARIHSGTAAGVDNAHQHHAVVGISDCVDPPGVAQADIVAPSAEVSDQHAVAGAAYAVPPVLESARCKCCLRHHQRCKRLGAGACGHHAQHVQEPIRKFVSCRPRAKASDAAPSADYSSVPGPQQGTSRERASQRSTAPHRTAKHTPHTTSHHSASQRKAAGRRSAPRRSTACITTQQHGAAHRSVAQQGTTQAWHIKAQSITTSQHIFVTSHHDSLSQ